MHDSATAHALVGRLTVSDDRGHIATIRVKGANNAAHGAGTDIKAYELFGLHLDPSITLLLR
jgi:hypothetical protein